MRTDPPDLLPLFRSEMQVGLLGLLILQANREWTLAELAKHLGASPSSVHRELLRAVNAGLITRDDAQRPHRYGAAEESPVYPAVRDLLERTTGVRERLRTALAGHDAIHAAVIHGSWAAGRVQPLSDIDLLIIADRDRSSIQRILRKVGQSVGREVDASLLSTRDFRQLVRDDNPFLKRIVQGPRMDLVGDLDDLLAGHG